jgi:hypothetical protein
MGTKQKVEKQTPHNISQSVVIELGIGQLLFWKNDFNRCFRMERPLIRRGDSRA